MTHLLRCLGGFTLFTLLVDRNFILKRYFGNLDWLVGRARHGELVRNTKELLSHRFDWLLFLDHIFAVSWIANLAHRKSQLARIVSSVFTVLLRGNDIVFGLRACLGLGFLAV